MDNVELDNFPFYNLEFIKPVQRKIFQKSSFDELLIFIWACPFVY